jgi:hypothetical protein
MKFVSFIGGGIRYPPEAHVAAHLVAGRGLSRTIPGAALRLPLATFSHPYGMSCQRSILMKLDRS